MEPSQVPDFDDLPPVEGMPQGCAWGIFDKDGKKDLIGTLNFLTPSVVKEAFKEARDGVSISLNWPLNAIAFPLPGRIQPEHKQMTLRESGLSSGTGWDDELHFNTQLSSQWDSLVHWAHQASGLSYNGIEVTKELLSSSSASGSASAAPTLEHWHGVGGMVARGVLIDFKAWAEKNLDDDTTTQPPSLPYHPLDGHRITIQQLEAIALSQGVRFKPGDVLILRTGLTEVLGAPGPEDFAKLQQGKVAGVHGVRESARWIWDKRFAAVAGDAWAFEALMPLREEDGEVGGPADLYLHPWLLSMFGMSIGELWDLKALSEHCEKTGRYSFLLTSAPLNIPGLIGSPPNAMAIF
ncbi:hypothetical protein F4778DRAFT_236545 [Xylariomycetidae sp. FL2044]|nr:hypothetical protein F4778DRAFT_236545 [Xylariomycetidae sp. FL2044]